MTYHSKFLGNEKGHFVLFSGLVKITILIMGIVVLGTFYQIEGIAISIVLAAIGDMIFSLIMAKRVKWKNLKK